MGRIVNAAIGAIAAVVLAFLPFSTVIGGALSGFLEGGDTRAGTVAGALAGLITLLPFAGLGLLGLAVLTAWFGVLGVPAGGVAAMVVVFAVLAAAAVVYTVGFGAVGGYLGAALAREYPDSRVSVRDTIGMDREAPTGRERYGVAETDRYAETRLDDTRDPIDRALDEDRERSDRADRTAGDAEDAEPERFER